MTDDLKPLAPPEFADAIAKLETLLSQDRRAFLLGAGCSYCAGLPLMTQLTDEVLASSNVSSVTKNLLHSMVDRFSGAESATIEDYMSELVDLLAIAERRSWCRATNQAVHISDTSYGVPKLVQALEEIKQAIADSISGKDTVIDVHRLFVRAIHGTLQSGKASGTRVVDYFVLNYDTLIEDALALEKQSLTDGFSGGVTGWWDEDCFRSANVVARVFKVHGSIDWCLWDGEVMPRRLRPGMTPASSTRKLLIWPAATKYRETQRDPYAQILAFMRASLRPPASCESVLTICGYGFGDSHINLEIDRALHESGERLTVVAFTNDEEPRGQLRDWLDDPYIRDQIRVHARRGFFHGSDIRRSTVDLPWWKFETVARLLGGER